MHHQFCRHFRPSFPSILLAQMRFFTLLLLILASARAFPGRHERRIDELVAIDGPSSGAPLSILFLPENGEKSEDNLKKELLAPYGDGSKEDTEAMAAAEEEDENVPWKRAADEGARRRSGGGIGEGGGEATGGQQSRAELFTRMRSICAKMPRLKRKRTPKPGSAESLVAFLCSNANIFR